MMSVSEKFRDRSALGISNECDRVTIFKIVSPCRCASLPASRNSLSGVFRKTSDVKSFPCQYIQVTCETLVTIFFLTELSHVLPHTPKSSLKQHALNQRSPARSGIENRWPKGKAKVKGRSPWKQHALKGQKLLAQGIALGNYGHKPVALFYSN